MDCLYSPLANLLFPAAGDSISDVGLGGRSGGVAGRSPLRSSSTTPISLLRVCLTPTRPLAGRSSGCIAYYCVQLAQAWSPYGTCNLGRPPFWVRKRNVWHHQVRASRQSIEHLTTRAFGREDDSSTSSTSAASPFRLSSRATRPYPPEVKAVAWRLARPRLMWRQIV